MLLLLSAWPACHAAEEVEQTHLRDTPHNLTQSGPAPRPGKRAIGRTSLQDTDICKPCHVTHGGIFAGIALGEPNPHLPQNQAEKMLWSRALTPVTYELYRSSTAKGVPTQPEGVSRLCLSCHDGTIATAPSHLTTRPSDEILAGSFTVARQSLSRSLASDHPIMVHQDAVARMDPQMRDAKSVDAVYRLERSDIVHCTTCHDPHRNDMGAFLVTDPVGGKLCTACHQLHGWTQSIHATSTRKPADAVKAGLLLQNVTPRAETLRDHACLACHETHNAPTAERLLKDGADQRPVCLNCHDGSFGPQTPLLLREFEAPYAHDVIHLGKLHDALENLQPNGDLLDGRHGARKERHVHCDDCHSAHETASGTHAIGTNLVSAALRGATGLQLNYGGQAWNRPDWKYLPSGAHYEYEICMKCHSYWSWGSFPPLASRQYHETDPSVEFNPNNPSYHAVVGASKAGPRGMFVQPWRRDSKMYCSDCHGMPGGSSGPHGSTLPSMLRAPFTRDMNGGDDLCAKCHQRNTYTKSGNPRTPQETGFSSDHDKENMHVSHARLDSPLSRQPIACQDCHAAVPHGWQRRAMIVFKTDPAPYVDGATIDSIKVFPAAGQWRETDCTTACHNAKAGRKK